MRAKGFYLGISLFLSVLLLGCAAKPIVKMEIKEVYIPVRCNLEIPLKPKENGSFESHKELSLYYREVEQIAKDCTKQE